MRGPSGPTPSPRPPERLGILLGPDTTVTTVTPAACKPSSREDRPDDARSRLRAGRRGKRQRMFSLPFVLVSMGVALAILLFVTLSNRKDRQHRDPSDRTP